MLLVIKTSFVLPLSPNAHIYLSSTSTSSFPTSVLGTGGSSNCQGGSTHDDVCSNVQRGSFCGHLTSITFAGAGYLFIVIGDKMFGISKGDLIGGNGNTDSLSGPMTDAAAMGMVGRPLKGYYLYGESSPLAIVLDETKMVVTSKTGK